MIIDKAFEKGSRMHGGPETLAVDGVGRIIRTKSRVSKRRDRWDAGSGGSSSSGRSHGRRPGQAASIADRHPSRRRLVRVIASRCRQRVQR